MSSGAGSFQRSRKVSVERADDRALQPQLHVVPRRMLAVALGHLHRLRVAAMRRVVAAGVAQVNAARERDVALGRAGMPDDDQLLVMRPAEPDALVQQHLTACLFDRVAEMLVLLLAVLELVQM